MSLPHSEVYLFHGMERFPAMVSIYEVFEMHTPTKLLLVQQEDFEFCDTLHMMFGRSPEILTLWDWHDKVWDTIHDRRMGMDLNYCMRDVACPIRNLADLVQRPSSILKIEREEIARRERLKQPPIYFTGSLKEFIL